MSSVSLPSSPAIAAAPGVPFLDPHALIEASAPRGVGLPNWPLLAVGMTLVLVWSTPTTGPMAAALRVLAPLMLAGFWISMLVYRSRLTARIVAETEAVVAIEELIQLRRWAEAADLAQRVLSRPMALPDRRLTALMNLATLLTRYHRFADARVVHDYLLGLTGSDGDLQPDGSTAHALRVARAMTMLREDHLVDADKAMNDLRREVNRARDEVRREHGGDEAGRVHSAGLMLLDLYRDIKTYHYEEAAANFERHGLTMREQLGVRIADAWVLAAMAYHGLKRADDARAAYLNATSLTPAVELHRRYPETADIANHYPAAIWPDH